MVVFATATASVSPDIGLQTTISPGALARELVNVAIAMQTTLSPAVRIIALADAVATIAAAAAEEPNTLVVASVIAEVLPTEEALQGKHISELLSLILDIGSRLSTLEGQASDTSWTI